ncbi:MAG TPA: hypothetical protein VGZ29_09520 [Terriglobia bacterium]|nr:hypothetical protein [Terriglobia bacterium]
MNTALKPDGMNVMAALIIAAFAIDRIVAGLLFLIGFCGKRARAISDPAFAADPQSARLRQLIYFLTAAPLCAAVLIELPGFRVLSGLGYPANATLDTLITALIMLGGADRMSDLVGKLPEAAQTRPAPKPLEVTGRVILEEAGEGRDERVAGPRAVSTVG